MSQSDPLPDNRWDKCKIVVYFAKHQFLMGFIWFCITPDQAMPTGLPYTSDVIHIVLPKTPIKSLWFALFEALILSNWVDNLSHPKA